MFSILSAAALVVAPACKGRSIGSPTDAGVRGCPTTCQAPWVCDEAAGRCVCPQQCCGAVDCFCDTTARTCREGGIAVCEPRLVDGEDGLCGSVCDYPIVEACADGCDEPTPGEAVCLASACDVRGSERYTVTASVSGQTYGCDGLFPTGSDALDFEGAISSAGAGEISVQAADGRLYAFTHDAANGGCLYPGLPVTVRASWNNSTGWFCTMSLLILDSEGWPLLWIQDGETSSPTGAPLVIRDDLGCPAGTDPGCADPAVYRLHVSFSIEHTVGAHQGDSVHLDVGTRLYEFHNGRSYESGFCDDYWNYAFYLASLCPRG